MTSTTTDHATTVATVYRAFGSGDIDTLMGLIAQDVRWESDWEDNFAQRAGGPAFYRPFHGRDSLGGFFSAMGANTFHQLDVRDVIVDGDRAVARVALEYTMPSGGRYRDEQLHLWTFDDQGKIVAIRHFLDTAKLLAATRGEDTTAGSS
jgi:ketosteroid isomerase-like protein